MTHPNCGTVERSQADEAGLVEAVRAGNSEAYGVIYRRYAQAALACARRCCRSTAAAEDLRAEAFTRMLGALRTGRGPLGPVLPYLKATIRNLAATWERRDSQVSFVDDPDAIEDPRWEQDVVLARGEQAMAAQAFAALPDRWRTVLKRTVIEAERPGSVRPTFEISASALSSLTYRARERLREAYLQAHICYIAYDSCRPFVVHLGAYTRGRVSRVQQQQLRRHLAECPECAKLFAMLRYVNAGLDHGRRAPHDGNR